MRNVGTNHSKRKITYTFNYSKASGSSGQYESELMLSDSDSIRLGAIRVISEAKSKEPDIVSFGPIESSSISIYLANKKIANITDGRNETSKFGLNYSLEPDGSLRILNGFAPLHHDWTVAEIRELVNESYVKGDPGHLIIGVPIGLGAGGRDITTWIDFFNNVISLSTYGYIAVRFVSKSVSDRPYKKIAKDWVSRGILYPEQLREFIDQKPGWKLDEVCKRLKINTEFAYRLLNALGLEPVGEYWKLTQTAQSIKKRKAWTRNEKKYQKIREKLIIDGIEDSVL